jgi:hypothetical protein
MLLWALREANETVPRKSAFFLDCTGVLQSSIRCLLARPKSTMNTYLLSRESTKFDYKHPIKIGATTYCFNVSMNEAAIVDFFDCIQHFYL